MKRKGGDVWYFRYRRDGKEVAVKVGSFPTKATARKEVDRLGLREQANTAGKPANSVPVTFGRVVGLWLKKELSTHAVTSQNGIRSYLRQHILRRWRRIPISEIKPRDLRDWLQSLDLNGATVRKIKAVIGAIFSFAVFEELASTNPAKGWKLKGMTSDFEPVIVPPDVQLPVTALGLGLVEVAAGT